MDAVRIVIELDPATGKLTVTGPDMVQGVALWDYVLRQLERYQFQSWLASQEGRETGRPAIVLVPAGVGPGL